jgi:hypothetical protein
MTANRPTSSISSPPGLDGRLGGGMLPSGAACRRGAMTMKWWDEVNEESLVEFVLATYRDEKKPQLY